MIKKVKIQKYHLIYTWFFFIIIIECLISFNVVPSIFRYISDLVNIGIFLVSIFFVKKANVAYRVVLIGLLIILLYCSIELIMRRNNIINFVWGVRFLFSPIIYLLNLLFLLNESDTKHTINFLHFIFWVNLIFSLVEFALGYINDFNGGIFGVASGCNTGQNILLVSVCILDLYLFYQKKASLPYLICTFLCCLLISIFAELKIFFFEIGIIIVCYLFGTKMTLSKLFLIVCAVLSVFLFYRVSVSINAGFAGNWDLDYIISYLSSDRGYTNSGDINRLNGISILSSTVFGNEPRLVLFGAGLGMASPSSISAVDTSFYVTYSYLHYDWFAYSLVFIETGIIGLILYCALLFSILVLLFTKRSNRFLALSFLALVSMLLVYNDSMISFKNLVPFYLLFSIPLIETFNKGDCYDKYTERIKTHLKIREKTIL